MTESAKDFYSRNAEKYDETHSEEDWSEEFKKNLSKFCELVNGDVLDAGCGPGSVTEFLCEQGFETVGIDIAEGMVKYARENKEGRYLRMDISDLDFDSNVFSGVWCGSTIFFLEREEIEKTLGEFRRVLQEEGVLYVDFKEGDGSYLKRKWGEEVEEYRISETEAREILKENDFEVLKFVEWKNNRGANYLEFLCRKV